MRTYGFIFNAAVSTFSGVVGFFVLAFLVYRATGNIGLAFTPKAFVAPAFLAMITFLLMSVSSGKKFK